jgi:hypothetical protein
MSGGVDLDLMIIKKSQRLQWKNGNDVMIISTKGNG